MKTVSKLALIAGLISTTAIGQVSNVDLPKEDNYLYTVATGCKILDLKSWQHPTRNVLESHNFKIQQVKLCNDNKYPIFIGEAEYMLDTQPNHKLASAFFLDLLHANANWPYALVDTSGHYVAYIEPYKENGKIVGISSEGDYY